MYRRSNAEVSNANDAVMDYLRRRVLALRFKDKHVSGTLVRDRGELFVSTVLHLFEDDGLVEGVHQVELEAYSLQANRWLPIRGQLVGPHPEEADPQVHTDFVLLVLDMDSASALVASGCEAVDSDQVGWSDEMSDLAFYLCGFPTGLYAESRPIPALFEMSLAPKEKMDGGKYGPLVPGLHHVFHLQLEGTHASTGARKMLSNIEGASGGPYFAFPVCEDGDLWSPSNSRMVAIQSTQWLERGVAKACDSSHILDVIEFWKKRRSTATSW